MIKINIERETVEKYTEIKNFVTESQPTTLTKRSSYGNQDEFLCAEKFATKEVTLERTVRTTLLTQEIQDESTFDLASVIVAINGIGRKA